MAALAAACASGPAASSLLSCSVIAVSGACTAKSQGAQRLLHRFGLPKVGLCSLSVDPFARPGTRWIDGMHACMHVVPGPKSASSWWSGWRMCLQANRCCWNPSRLLLAVQPGSHAPRQLLKACCLCSLQMLAQHPQAHASMLQEDALPSCVEQC